MMNQIVADKKLQVSLILIQFGGEEFAIDLLDVKEIIQAGQIRRLPKGLGFIEGIYNYRGDIIHIINPKKKLGIEENRLYKRKQILNEYEGPDPNNDSKDQYGPNGHNGPKTEFIIIVSLANNYIGFLVDRIINVAHLTADAIEGLSPIVQTNINIDCIKGIVKMKDRPRIWLDLKKILTESEQESIQRELIP